MFSRIKNAVSSRLLSTWRYLGFGQQKAKIVLLGLDSAGKTTLLSVLASNVLRVHEPTQMPQQGQVQIGHVTFSAFDMGGHAAARRLWQNYLCNINGVVFVVDSSDVSRFEEVIDELRRLIHSSDLDESIPILLLANKSDQRFALAKEDLSRALNLDALMAPRTNFAMFSCSVVRRVGYLEGFRWLSEKIKFE